MHCRYGFCFKTKLFGETHVFISSKESAKVILRNEGGKFSKKYIKSISKLLGPDSLLCAAEHHHKLIRSRLLSLFSPHSLPSFVQLFDELVTEATSTWTCGSLVIIQDEALKVHVIFPSSTITIYLDRPFHTLIYFHCH